MKRTKIVCTIGPSSRAPAVLEALVDAGMDVARLNMSHGRREEHGETIRHVRRIAAEKDRPVAVLFDLAGPKIRLGRIAEHVTVEAGDTIRFVEAESCSEPGVLPVDYEAFDEEVAPGQRFFLADGLIEMDVLETGKGWVRARALSAGEVTSRKGINLPTGGTRLPVLTEKDIEDLRFGLQLGVDWVALSFVRAPEDARPLHELMDSVGTQARLIAKIEKPQALQRIGPILETFDGLMVARGDLGVEVPLEQVPGIQKNLIRQANRRAKPVITATQMLLSMVHHPRPTRAEVSDVANAILDGTDAVMLSEETAIGADPARVVRTMAAIARQAETMYDYGSRDEHPPSRVTASIGRAAVEVAEQVGASVIVSPTTGGTTARLVASHRPPMPILALSSHRATIQELCLSWGVRGQLIDDVSTTDQLIETCRRETLRLGLAQPSDRIVVTAGLPLSVPGSTNLLQVLELS